MSERPHRLREEQVSLPFLLLQDHVHNAFAHHGCNVDGVHRLAVFDRVFNVARQHFIDFAMQAVTHFMLRVPKSSSPARRVHAIFGTDRSATSINAPKAPLSFRTCRNEAMSPLAAGSSATTWCAGALRFRSKRCHLAT